MNRFEYKCVIIRGIGTMAAKELNVYGNEGWELVFIVGDWHYLKKTVVEE